MSILDILDAQALLSIIALLLKNTLEWLLRRYDCKKFKNEIEEDLKRISSEYEKITCDLRRFSVNFNRFLKKILREEISVVEDMVKSIECELHSLFNSIISFFESLGAIKLKMCYYASECLKSPRERANFRIKIENIDKTLKHNLDLWTKTKEYAYDPSFRQKLIDIGFEPTIADIILQIIKDARLEDIISIEMLRKFREQFREVVEELIEAGRPYQF